MGRLSPQQKFLGVIGSVAIIATSSCRAVGPTHTQGNIDLSAQTPSIQQIPEATDPYTLSETTLAQILSRPDLYQEVDPNSLSTSEDSTISPTPEPTRVFKRIEMNPEQLAVMNAQLVILGATLVDPVPVADEAVVAVIFLGTAVYYVTINHGEELKDAISLSASELFGNFNLYLTHLDHTHDTNQNNYTGGLFSVAPAPTPAPAVVNPPTETNIPELNIDTSLFVEGFTPGSPTELANTLTEMFLFESNDEWKYSFRDKSLALVEMIQGQFPAEEIATKFNGHVERYSPQDEHDYAYVLAMNDFLRELMQDPSKRDYFEAALPAILNNLEAAHIIDLDPDEVNGHMNEGDVGRVQQRYELLKAIAENRVGPPKCIPFPGNNGSRIALLYKVLIDGKTKYVAFVYNHLFPERSTLLKFRNENHYQKYVKRVQETPQGCWFEALGVLREIYNIAKSFFDDSPPLPPATG